MHVFDVFISMFGLYFVLFRLVWPTERANAHVFVLSSGGL